MRHQKAGRKYGRNTSHRRAMFRNLAGNLVLNERIETTDAKAKELRRIADRLITHALRLGGELTVDVTKLEEEDRLRIIARRVHAERQIAKFLPRRGVRTLKKGESFEEVDLVGKIVKEIAPRYLSRVQDGRGGGYTRIIKTSPRRGDGASMALIEFIPKE
jgi:large subunit ribosomal protein L17